MICLGAYCRNRRSRRGPFFIFKERNNFKIIYCQEVGVRHHHLHRVLTVLHGVSRMNKMEINFSKLFQKLFCTVHWENSLRVCLSNIKRQTFVQMNIEILFPNLMLEHYISIFFVSTLSEIFCIPLKCYYFVVYLKRSS